VSETSGARVNVNLFWLQVMTASFVSLTFIYLMSDIFTLLPELLTQKLWL